MDFFVIVVGGTFPRLNSLWQSTQNLFIIFIYLSKEKKLTNHKMLSAIKKNSSRGVPLTSLFNHARASLEVILPVTNGSNSTKNQNDVYTDTKIHRNMYACTF